MGVFLIRFLVFPEIAATKSMTEPVLSCNFIYLLLFTYPLFNVDKLEVDTKMITLAIQNCQPNKLNKILKKITITKPISCREK